LALLLLIPVQTQATGREERITAKAYALIEAGSGRLLSGEHERDRLPMASTTKIMTALLLLEGGEDLDTLVAVPSEAAGTEGSSMHLVAGEKLSLRDLLYGLMMVSGNDAAVTLAIHLSGSVDAFAAQMNARAAALGCTDTHFVNPNGLHDPSHYTSAYDLARIAAAAMELPFFRELVSTQRYTASTGDRPRSFHTKNKVLTQMEGGCGVKTGFTKKAGRCLCFAARREGMLLVGVVLNAPDMWNDAKALLDRGFSEYELHTYLTEGQRAGEIPVTGSEKKALPVAAKEGILYPVRKDGRDETVLDIRPFPGLAAPVEAGAAAGEAVLSVNGEPVKTVLLIVREGAPPLTYGWFLKRVMGGYLTA
jgi:D-alanyl-D-alanine carboxypeptidase (penicillin-binding protein 5/6)